MDISDDNSSPIQRIDLTFDQTFVIHNRLLLLQYLLITILLLFLIFRALVAVTISRHKATTKENENKRNSPVSWIICAKNELQRLKKNLPIWLEQDYQDWELILVLDRCTDGSKEWIEKTYRDHPHLKLVENKKSQLKGKRNALWYGVQKAQYNHLLLSDADCIPASNEWMNEMTGKMKGKTQFVLGISPYEKKKGLLNLLIRQDCFQTVFLYISFALMGRPYMGVGRNLGVKKEMISKDFLESAPTLSGDDDLLINAYATGDNTAVCIEPKAHMISASKSYWKDFLQQKKRHSQAGHYYHFFDRITLGLIYLFQILFYLSGLTICFLFSNNIVLITIFISALIINWCLLSWINHKLRFKLGLSELLIGDFCVSFFLISLGILSAKQVKKW